MMTQERYGPYYLSHRAPPPHAAFSASNMNGFHPIPEHRMFTNPSVLSRDKTWMTGVVPMGGKQIFEMEECSIERESMTDDLLSVDDRIRPLIKEELRLSIQSKRIARGLPGTVEIEYKAPKPDDVTQEDLMKRERRRERNKVAAAKCRFKKKIVSERLQEESEQLEHINMKISQEIERLKEEKDKLSSILDRHKPSCVAMHVDDPTQSNEQSSSPGFASLPHLQDQLFPSKLLSVSSCGSPAQPSICDLNLTPPTSSQLHLTVTQSC